MPDQRKILAMLRVKLPRSGREGAVEVRPFPAEKRPRASEAQGLSGEAVKGNPTTVLPRVDESKITPEELSEPNGEATGRMPENGCPGATESVVYDSLKQGFNTILSTKLC